VHDKIELARFGCVVVIWVWYFKLYNCCGKWWVSYWQFCGLFQ